MTEAFFEKLNNFYYRIFVPEKTIVSEKSEYQQIDIVQSKNGNKALILDGTIQLYTGDEFVYHEMVVHLPLIHHPNPEKILVLGGGDGFLAREALKYKSVKEIVIVDLDGKVVEICKKYFAEETGNSFDDPRVKVIIDDAMKYMDYCKDKYDIVIMDLVDPYGEGSKLYAKETVEKFSRLLKEDGILATHCEDASPPYYVGMKIYAQLSHLFPHHKAGLAYIKSFDGLWTFVLLSKREMNPVNGETPNLKLKFFEADKARFYTKLPPFLEDKFNDFRQNGFKKLALEPTFMGPVSPSDTVGELIKKA